MSEFLIEKANGHNKYNLTYLLANTEEIKNERYKRL